jgi:hypothetical protein
VWALLALMICKMNAQPCSWSARGSPGYSFSHAG